MELEGLVEEITRKVLAELTEAECKKTVLLFAQKDSPLPESLQEVLKDEYRLFYAADDLHIDRIDRFILPCLYIDQMVDLAMGKGGSKLMYAVRKVLLAGKQLEVADFEYRKYSQSAPMSLLALYEQYYETLRGFGVVELQGEAKSVYRVNSGVVKESDIITAKQNGAGSIEIGNSCCVTPLAYDFAREQSIEIKEVVGGGR